MRCTSLIALAAVALPLFGQQLQNRPAVLQLSLKQAVDIAVAPEGNTRVRLAQEALKQAESRANQSRAALLPDATSYLQYQNQTNTLKAFGFNFPAVDIPGFSFQVPSFIGPFNVFDTRGSVNQSVFDFSAWQRYRASKITIEAVKADNEGTRDQVTDQVARAYLAAKRADASLETANANVELSEALLKLANSQKAAGTGTGIEITRAQVQLANDRQQLPGGGEPGGSDAAAIVESDRSAPGQSRGIDGQDAIRADGRNGAGGGAGNGTRAPLRVEGAGAPRRKCAAQLQRDEVRTAAGALDICELRRPGKRHHQCGAYPDIWVLGEASRSSTADGATRAAWRAPRNGGRKKSAWWTCAIRWNWMSGWRWTNCIRPTRR